jgi:hypothetical protein
MGSVLIFKVSDSCVLLCKRIIASYIMKKKLVFIAFIACQVLHAQNTYYISNDGDNSKDGLSEANAWQTIEKLNTVSLSPGDSVLFERGGVFTGQIEASYSGTASDPIYYGAYGTGAKPVVSGAIPIALSPEGTDNVYSIDTATEIKGLYRNGKKAILARTPNSGFYSIESGSKSSITDNANLSGATDYYKDANIRLRSSNYTFEARKISSSGSGTLNWAENLFYSADAGWGYYLDNHADFLDTTNEWYYNRENQKLLYYTTASPTGSDFQGTVHNYGINVGTNKSHIVVEGLHFMYQALDGIYLYGTINGITITNCDFSHVERHGINFVGTYNNITIKHNTFENIYGSGIMANSLSNAEISGNSFYNIGMLQGYGGVFGMPINNNSGIGIKGDHIHVHHNTTDSTGYIGIRVDGEYNIIEKNYVQNAVLTQNDGGGLYAWGEVSENSTFRYNIVDNVVGNTEGTPGKGLIIAALYLDNGTHDMRIENNTLIRSTGMGILCNQGTRRDTLKNNLIFDFASSGINFPEKVDDSSNIGNLVIDNTLVGLNEKAFFVVKSTTNSVDDYNPGTFNNNLYFNPYNNLVFKSSKTGGNHVHQQFSFDAWKEEAGSDNNSKNLFWGWNLHEPTDTTGDNMINNSTFDSDINGWSKWTNGTAELSHVGASELDGGALKLQNTSSTSTDIAFSINVLHSGYAQNQWYQLSFSIISSQKGNVLVTPKRDFSPYTGFGVSRTVPFFPERMDYLFTFQSTENIDPARLDFQISADDGEYTLDNVSLLPVNVQYHDPNDKIKVFYNPTDNPKIIQLNDTFYMKLDSTLVCDDFNLAPWSSIVLIKQDSTCEPVSVHNPSADEKNKNASLLIYPVPANNDITFISPEKIKKIQITDLTGKVFKNIETVPVYEKKINIQDMHPGLYLISLQGMNGMIFTNRFIVY